MEIVWVLVGLVALGWIMRLFEKKPPESHSPANVKVTYRTEKSAVHLSPAQKEYRRQYRIWTTQINGTGVDPNSYWGRIREEVFRRYYECCAYCGSVENLTVHHKQPLSLGGDNDLDNLILLCKECHEAGHGRKFLNRSFESDDDYGMRFRVSEKVKILNDAINNQQGVQIKYTDMNEVRSVRTIHPSKIRRRNRGTYVQAFCDLDKDERIFRLSRMKIYKKNENKNYYIDEPKSFDHIGTEIIEDFRRLFS